MATVATSKGRVQRVLLEVDSTGTISQQNYFDNELWDYYNKAIESLSKEFAKINSKLDLQNTTLAFTALTYSDLTSLAALSPGFLSIAKNDKGEDRVFNVTNSYARMSKADESDIDGWESEDDSDDGTPGEFYLRGLNFYIHPRPTVNTSVKIYYNPLRTITNDSSTMPWNSLFDSAIERFVIAMCRMRSELIGYNPSLDIGIYDNLRKDAMDIIYQREGLEFNFAPGFGWDA